MQNRVNNHVFPYIWSEITPPMAERGRPTDYTPEHAKQAKKLAVLGMSNKAIAEFFEIAESTLYEWQNNHPEFSEALKKAKITADARVAKQLYRRAIGFRTVETTYERIGPLDNVRNDADGTVTTQDLYKKRVVIKRVAGDVTAQTLWLKNRQPDSWRDNKSMDHNFSGPVSFVYSEGAGNDPIADE